jgi:hypothetical protein
MLLWVRVDCHVKPLSVASCRWPGFLSLRTELSDLMIAAHSSGVGVVRSVSIVCHPPQLGSGQPHTVNLTG